MHRNTLVLPQPDGPNSAVMPRPGAVNSDIQREAAEAAGKGDLDVVRRRHCPARRMRFSTSIMARMTTKAKTTMPAASMLASRQRSVSTKS
jgi:hypothetical protein